MKKYSPGWMDGWMDERKSRSKDCLQQSKMSIIQDRPFNIFKVFLDFKKIGLLVGGLLIPQSCLVYRNHWTKLYL